MSDAAWCFYVLPSVQVGLFFYPLVGFWTVFIAGLPVLTGLCFLNCNCIGTIMTQKRGFLIDKVVWILMCLVSVLMVYAYIDFLRNKGGYVGLICLAGFLQALWINTFSKVPVNYPTFWNKNVLFLFGSVGLVLVNSVALMTDLISEAVNGKRLVEDQRIVVFPSECLFTLPLLILPIFKPWTAFKSESQGESLNSENFDGTQAEKWTSFKQNQRRGKSFEMQVVRKVPLSSKEEDENIT
ncbi:uncharacterized protein [Misgurnus anguillicaudatus]|uniref:uncharacterized protein n=1 Tax=Misgurnus anguillicaudatus TaxID=75329 RepID=UPI003CCF1CCD